MPYVFLLLLMACHILFYKENQNVLTENKVNLQYDYLGEGTNDIADLDKYKFPELPRGTRD